MEAFAILSLVLVLVCYVVCYRDALKGDSDVRDCDCRRRDPVECIREQCFEEDHQSQAKTQHPEDCDYCAEPCACDCHYTRRVIVLPREG